MAGCCLLGEIMNVCFPRLTMILKNAYCVIDELSMIKRGWGSSYFSEEFSKIRI